MTPATLIRATIAGAALIILGLILGLAPVRANGIPCGDGFHNSGAGYGHDLYNALGGDGLTDNAGACADAISARRLILWPMIGFGIAALVGVGIAEVGRREQSRNDRDASYV